MGATEVAVVRENISEQDDTGGWTDVRIQNVLNGFEQDTNLSSAHIWSIKAADTAVFVDITENGSSRKMSDVHKNAIAMSAYWKSIANEAIVVDTGRPRTRAIVRP